VGDGEKRIATGSHDAYYWLISTEHYIGTLVRQHPGVVLDRYVAITSMDSGAAPPTQRHERIGWQCRGGGVCYSPGLRTTDELLGFQVHGDRFAATMLLVLMSGIYLLGPPSLAKQISGHPRIELQPGGTLVFVNYYNFALDGTDPAILRGLIELFWQQLDRIRPEWYICRD
jgi:hypothetical protein